MDWKQLLENARDRNMTMSELSREIGVTPATVHRHAKKYPSIELRDGRKTDVTKDKVMGMIESGMTISEIAPVLGVSYTRIHQIVTKHNNRGIA